MTLTEALDVLDEALTGLSVVGAFINPGVAGGAAALDKLTHVAQKMNAAHIASTGKPIDYSTTHEEEPLAEVKAAGG